MTRESYLQSIDDMLNTASYSESERDREASDEMCAEIKMFEQACGHKLEEATVEQLRHVWLRTRKRLRIGVAPP